MSFIFLTQILAVAGAIFCIAAFAARLRTFTRLPLPGDRSEPKGDPAKGVAYALTLGMMPWAKESTRRHLLAYLRGVGFHAMLALSFVMFLTSPWLPQYPAIVRTGLAVLTGIGALFALLGFLARFMDKSLKAISTPDDYFAILLVSLFLGTASLAAWNTGLLPVFYLFSTLVFIYMPLGKIRHCIYFAFSRLFFGKFFGRRAILPHNQQEVTA